MIDDGRRIVAPDLDPASPLFSVRHQPGRMHLLVGASRKFGHITADKFPLRVEFFGLRHGIEDAKPGLRIASGGSGPLSLVQ